MDKKRMWRPILLGLLVLFSGLYVLPSLVPGGAPDWYPFKKRLNYGLDLRGGLELRYAVDYKRAIAENTLRVREGVAEELVRRLAERAEMDPDNLTEAEREEFAGTFEVNREHFDSLLVVFDDPGASAMVTTDVARAIDPNYMRQRVDDRTIRLRLSDARIDEIRQHVVDQTLQTFRRRVEAFGLIEPDVRQSGETDIAIQLPGLTQAEMDMVRERLGQTAQLIFRMVDDRSDFFRDKASALETFKRENPERAATLELKCVGQEACWLEAERKSALAAFISTLDIPEDRTVGFQEIEERDGAVVARSYYRTVYLHARIELSGETLARAMVLFEQTGEPYVSLEFNAAGARRFAAVTRQNVGERLAIMLDDEVNSAPVIQEEIPGGRARISMGGGRPPQELMTDARALVTVLNQGAYRAPVHRVHDYEVGPSLGRDSIRAGTLSLIVGALLVICFILFYYRFAGVVANIALTLNVLFILAILVSFNTALTLPGFAGIVLTIGMAVDANVIIFERIREELRAGKSARVAIDTGYSKAFSAIIDANVTTAFAGLILLTYTSGPVQGFAKTLLIGLVASLFTALVVTRMIFRLTVERWKLETLSI